MLAWIKKIFGIGTPTAESVVLALLGDEEKYGLELIRASDGRLRRGSVYVLLDRMEEASLVTSRQEAKTPPHIAIPRRLYRATAEGKALLRAHAGATTHDNAHGSYTTHQTTKE
jgi:DNA-binding PadR family transcriptional regulator